MVIASPEWNACISAVTMSWCFPRGGGTGTVFVVGRVTLTVSAYIGINDSLLVVVGQRGFDRGKESSLQRCHHDVETIRPNPEEARFHDGHPMGLSAQHRQLLAGGVTHPLIPRSGNGAALRIKDMRCHGVTSF